MPWFRYTDDEARYYPDIAVSAVKDDVVQAASNPDGARFVKATAAEAKTAQADQSKDQTVDQEVDK